MRLSEAIRIGAKMKPAGRGSESAVRTADRVCALGAAACAGEVDGTSHNIYNNLARRWPILDEPVTKEHNPSKYGYCTSVSNTIWHLNDLDKWSREAIADWVEQVEDEALECGLLTKEQLGYA